MFARASTLVAVVLAALGSAARIHHARGGGDSQCSTGSVNCCNNAMNTEDTSLPTTLQTLGLPNVNDILALADIFGGDVGIQCTPFVVGAGASCENAPVCCKDNSFNGLINLGCSPINLIA